MTTTSHALTGAMIATVVKRPALAIPLALLSHFVCDAIPHFGLNMEFGSPVMFTWLIIDGLALMGFALFLLHKKVKNPLLLATSGFAAMSPDLAWLYYGLQGSLSNTALMDPVTRFHSNIQWFEHPIGIAVELAWMSLMVWIILRLNREGNQDPATSQA